MSATIKVGAFEAILDGWEWTGDDAWFVDKLNSMLDPEGPSGSDPAPDLHEARRTAKELGGQVVRFDKPEYVKDTVY